MDLALPNNQMLLLLFSFLAPETTLLSGHDLFLATALQSKVIYVIGFKLLRSKYVLSMYLFVRFSSLKRFFYSHLISTEFIDIHDHIMYKNEC